MSTPSVFRRFLQVDVFTDRSFLGNPVAVVLDAEDLDDAAMQAIARWTNLSETTFVLRPTRTDADWRLRIFTPGGELPFAGHPTLGTARALLHAGRATPRGGRLVQECGAGLVTISVGADEGSEDACPDRAAGQAAPRGVRPTDAVSTTGVGDAPDLLFLTLPEPRIEPLAAGRHAALAQALGLPSTESVERPAAIDVGPVWITARLPDAATVLALRPDLEALRRLTDGDNGTGITVFGAHAGDPSGAAWEVRSFAPGSGIAEDPVCGSGNGCVAAWLRAAGIEARHLARQGRAIGRDGFIHARERDGRILIGGQAVVCVDGTLRG